MDTSRSCKNCGRTLYSAKEKSDGRCEICSRTSASIACMKCGARLSLSGELSSGICRNCRNKRSCAKCGAALLPQESGTGFCERCRRRT